MSTEKDKAMNTEAQTKRVSFEKIFWILVTAAPVIAVLVLRLP